MRLQNVFTFLALFALAGLVFVVVRSLSAPKPPSQAPKVEQARPTPTHGTQILVARNDLGVGSFVTANDVETHDWPESAILPSQLRADQIPVSDIVGSVVRERMVKGEPVLRDKLVHPGDRGFLAAVLLPGMRAITIAVDNVSSHSGLLLPGDRVDIILTQNLTNANSPARAHVGETIVRAARVLAVGTAMAPPGKAGENVDDRARTMTFELTPKQAEMLFVATQIGQISIALRSLPATAADELEDQEATSGADLTKPTSPTWGANVSRALSGGPSIEIMRGTSGTTTH
jgi:pilus assembly protein CpaB